MIGTNYSVRNTYDLQQDYKRLATGKRINSAADDAAGLAISQKLTAVINGLSKETDNSYDMKNLQQTKEGGLTSINDNLQRMRELSLQAAGPLATDGDKKIIQTEIDQLKDNISSLASSTQFNTKNILKDVFGENVSAIEGLGLKDFDVTGNFSISDIDHALSIVNSTSSEIGSAMNRLDYTINSNQIAEVNQRTSLSKIEDLDFAKATTEKSTKDIINKFSMFTRKKQMEQSGNLLNMLL